MDAARVFVDGTFSEPRLAHPEGVAVHADGSVWCGTETGDLIRVEADGSRTTKMGSTGGFLLGIAFDSQGACYACDLKHAAVFKYDPRDGSFAKFASAGIMTPNYPIVDEARSALYVSDSHEFGVPGGGIYRYDLETGEGALWYGKPMEFANGMAMSLDGKGLYVVESTASRISYVGITDDGSPQDARIVVEGATEVPDGVMVLADGGLLISCYEPSRIYHYREDTGLRLLIADPSATVLAHPTNIALKGDTLYTANLGRWHLSAIDLAGVEL
jgi:sugar lactone lactonase YvrE